ncbi:MAG: RluA family pseudouridine synthase [Myxococcales bacterium]|nr:RluA family pseudouridine synthase [Myxococcales bacterium]
MTRTPPSFQVNAEEAGRTLSALLRGPREGIPADSSWNQVKTWCQRGKVQVDGTTCLDPARRMVEGERVSLHVDAPRHTPGRIGIVYVDADVVVVNKPSDMLSVPVRGSDPDSLVERAAAILARREKRRPRALEVVHRIDRGTSGLLLFARTAEARRLLKEQFAEHTTERSYRALAQGDAHSATHHTWLMEDRGDGLRGSWGVFRLENSDPPANTREAKTVVEKLERLRGATLVRCTLSTGRQHQIRIHLSEAGTPLVGEAVYIRDYVGPRQGAPRVMLHAASLGFTHPTSGERLRFQAPDPEDFATLLRRLRGKARSPHEGPST